jgi:hypothetical protein
MRPNGAGEQAVVPDAMEAAWQSGPIGRNSETIDQPNPTSTEPVV